MAQDPYQELGVRAHGERGRDPQARSASSPSSYHPDKNPGNKAAEERFKRVSAAFDLLGDEEKRKKFDAGEIDADGRETMRGFAAAASVRPGRLRPFGQGGFRAARSSRTST